MYKPFLNSDLFKDMIANGMKVYEEPYKFLHMKAYWIDGRYLNIGSFNQDVTSFYCNNEANVLIESKDDLRTFTEFGEMFDRLKSECNLVDPNERYSPWGYVRSKFWRLFVEGTYFLMKNRNR